MAETAAGAKLWSIETLRTYAVLGVVTTHAAHPAISASDHTPYMQVSPVLVGLDIFFVISGFLVWTITRAKAPTPVQFFLHRATRIVPLYTVATLLVAATAGVVGPYAYVSHTAVTPLRVLLSLAYIPYADEHGLVLPVLAAGWTLNFDMYFFALFALALAAPERWRLHAATALFTAPVVLHILLHPTQPALMVFTHPRALSFLAGIWIAHALERGWVLPRRPAQALAILALAAYVGLGLMQVSVWGRGLVLWIAAAVAATYAMVSVQASGRPWLVPPFAYRLGEWSYGVYLFQVLAIPFVCTWVPGPALLKMVAAGAASVALGALAFYAVERPANRALRRQEIRLGLRPGSEAAVTVAP